MQSTIINLDINSVEFEVLVEFNHTKGNPAITHLAPENCHPEEPEELEITSLNLFIENQSSRIGYDMHDISYLIEPLKEVITSKLGDILNEN